MNFIKANIDCIKAALFIQRNRFTSPEKIVTGTLLVNTSMYQPDTVNISDMMLLAQGHPTEIPSIMVFKFTDCEHLIYKLFANNEFINLPEFCQVALIEHEIGHIKHGHLEGMSLVKSIFINTMRTLFYEPPFEFEADEYAASIVGGAQYIAALTIFNNAREVKGYKNRGLRRRIEALSKRLVG